VRWPAAVGFAVELEVEVHVEELGLEDEAGKVVAHF